MKCQNWRFLECWCVSSPNNSPVKYNKTLIRAKMQREGEFTHKTLMSAIFRTVPRCQWALYRPEWLTENYLSFCVVTLEYVFIRAEESEGENSWSGSKERIRLEGCLQMLVKVYLCLDLLLLANTLKILQWIAYVLSNSSSQVLMRREHFQKKIYLLSWHWFS